MPVAQTDQFLIAEIASTAGLIARPVTLMEVCGTHTMAIYRHGIRSLLPANVRLISGPGCPVCVTAASTIDRMLYLADEGNRIITTFGDMIRVPGSAQSLQQARSLGADVRVVYSPADAVAIAQQNPAREVVFLAVGFETTAPCIASAVLMANQPGLSNFTVATALKRVPPSLNALLSSPKTKIDGLLCPGHVSVIIGSDAYQEIVEKFQIPCVIAGFEVHEILRSIGAILIQICEKKPAVENKYPAWVGPSGNPHALAKMSEVFEPCEAQWRGLGYIPESGFALRKPYNRFDAFTRYDVPLIDAPEPANCRCGEVLQGFLDPQQCPMFGGKCLPQNPIGPCMVSSEGACAAAYKFAIA